MNKARLEAFSDGVIAVIITIMVLALYAAAIPLAFVSVWISGAIYGFVALMWIVPDSRIEKNLAPEAPARD